MDTESNNRRHACVHGVVALGAAICWQEIAALVGHEVGLFEMVLGEELFEIVSQLIRKKKSYGMIKHLILFVPQQHGAAGVDIYDIAIVVFLDADHHNGVTSICPVLKDYLFSQSVLGLNPL